MVQTDLKSDNFCGFNQAASSMYWILDPVQNNLQYNVGETGVFTGVGLHTPGQVIDVSNTIVGGGRDNYLTKCNPPVPSMMSQYGNASDASIRNMGPVLPTQGLSEPGTDMQPTHNAEVMKNMPNSTHGTHGTNNTNDTDDTEKLVKADGSVVKRIIDRSYHINN